MSLFLLFSLPLYAAFLLTRQSWRQTIPYSTLIFGIIFASLYCFIEFFFTFSYYLTPYAFFSVFFRSFFVQTFAPFVIMGIFAFLFIRDFKQNVLWFSGIMIGFFIVFLPTYTIFENTTADFYLLFIRPIIYITFCYGLEKTIIIGGLLFPAFFLDKRPFKLKIRLLLKKIIVPLLIFIVVGMFPAFIDAWYKLNYPLLYLIVGLFVVLNFIILSVWLKIINGLQLRESVFSTINPF